MLFEQGVISSYVIRGNAKKGEHSTNSYLSPGAIDFWLETFIDWVELMFLMIFGIYFICGCCRRSRIRVGLGREVAIAGNVGANGNENRPRRGGVDMAAANNNGGGEAPTPRAVGSRR